MNRFIIPVLLLILIGLGTKFYWDFSSGQKAILEMEKERREDQKAERNETEKTISELKSQLIASEKKVNELNELLDVPVVENDATKPEIDQKLLAQRDFLRKELDRQQKRMDAAKISIMATINDRLSNLLDHRIRKISIFNDDTSFAYYVGRRNYMAIDAKNSINMQRTIHYTATGEYLKPLYQDQDNGNNRYMGISLNVDLDELNLNATKFENYYKKERPPFAKDFRQETYVELKIPLKQKDATIQIIESIQYQGESFEETSKTQNLEIYTVDEAEAQEVLSLLKLLKAMS